MSVHLIAGPSGSGKTHILYETVIREACARPDRSFLVLVPEQFTLETQRELTAAHPDHSLCNIDILSFQRLGCRLLEEAGMDSTQVLDDTGKNLILRQIAEEYREDLQILGAHLNRMGMIDELKSFLSELMQYALTPEDLDRMIEEAPHTPLKQKLSDIRLLYAAFLKKIDGKALTAEGLLSQSGRLAAESAMLRDTVVALDGYTGFTPVQNELLSALMHASADLYVTVTIDPQDADGFTRHGSMADLFWLSRRTIRQLYDLAGKAGTDAAEPVILYNHTQDGRFCGAPQLAHLERYLFRKNAGADTVYRFQPDETRQISVHVCTEPRDELLFCLRRIRLQVTQEGASYGGFAIMTGDLSRYENIAPSLFADYEIPYFFDRTRRLDSHPFSQALCALLRILTEDFSYRSIFGFLRSGFGPLSPEDTDLLENYVLATGLRGYASWRKTWTRNPQKLNEESLSQINDLRKTFCVYMIPLRETFADRSANTEEKTQALYACLVSLDAQQILAARAEAFREQGNAVRAREEDQIWLLVMQLLEKMVRLMGSAQVSAAEYLELLEAGFSAVTLRVAPPHKDTVLFGDMERTRLNHVKTLFLIGANDGVIPSAGSEGGILSEFERQSLKDAGEELAYTVREQALLQNFYLYQNLTKPQERLMITYAKRGSDGGALRRSPLVASVEKLFDGLTAAEEKPEAEEPLTACAGLEALARQTGELLADGETDLPDDALPAQWKALAAYCRQDAALCKPAEKILRAACGGQNDTRLKPETAAALYGTLLRSSVSRLEQYAACAFSHFAKYGLHLQVRAEASFASADMGDLLHDAVRNYTRRVRETGRSLHELSDADIGHYAQLAMDMAMADRAEDPAFESAANRQIVQRLRRVFYRTAQTLTRQVQDGTFEPSAEEVPFRVYWDLGDGRAMQLSGRIDRVDTAPLPARQGTDQASAAVRIVDYKSSGKDFRPAELYAGRSLQLPLYLEAVAETAAGMSSGAETVPAGMFYYAMIDPVLEEEAGESDPDLENRLRAQLLLSGPISADPQVLRAMDDVQPGEKSRSVHLERKKDGSIYEKHSSVYDPETFAVFGAYARYKAMESGRAVLDGNIGAAPYREKQKTACDFCAYRSVCGFDAAQEQFAYRVQEWDREEALRLIMEEADREGLTGGRTGGGEA